jgi:hypothetical protein
MKITFEEAKVAWEWYERLCNTGRACSDDANIAWLDIKRFFDEYDIKVWTIGAIILGSKYYAKYLVKRYQHSRNDANLRILKKEVKRLQFSSDLAAGIIAGKINLDEFINLI